MADNHEERIESEQLRIFVARSEYKFSAAHMTMFPDGSKERLHGHNFYVGVTVWVRRADHATLLDFSVIKKALNDSCAQWSERLLLPAKHPQLEIVRHDEQELEVLVGVRRYVLPADEVVLLPVDNVVVEQLAMYLWKSLRRKMDKPLREATAYEMEVSVSETEGQGAAYRGAVVGVEGGAQDG